MNHHQHHDDDQQDEHRSTDAEGHMPRARFIEEADEDGGTDITPTGAGDEEDTEGHGRRGP